MKRRFIVVSIGSFASVMLILFIGLNVLNYRQTIQREEERAVDFVRQELTYSSPQTPLPQDGEDSEEMTEPPAIQNNTLHLSDWVRGLQKNGNKGGKLFLDYFYVVFNSQSEVENTVITVENTDIKEDDVENLAREIYESQQQSGWSGRFRFVRCELLDGRTVIIYMDMTRAIQNIVQLLVLSMIIFIVILVLVAGVLWYFSEKAIMPLIRNVERQKEFISNASHEIKTPLAVLSTNNDVLEMIGMKNEWTQSNRKQIKRLNDLVEQMLLLARFDEGQVHIQLEKVDLTVLVQEVVADISGLIEETGFDVKIDMPEQVEVVTDEASIQRLLLSLLENALKYHTGEGAIVISWSQHNQLLSIENSCEPMTKEEQSQLFDRFYRRDTARHRETGGSGMGLSIAKAMAQMAKIDLYTQLPEETRIVFVLKFSGKSKVRMPK